MEPNPKTLCKIVTLSKNEYDLIEDFLIYYDSIVGVENIVIVDNGSDDPRVLAVYEKYRKRGLTVEGDSKGMMSMAQIVTDAILRHRGGAKFIMPLDTDEFLFFVGPESLESRKKRFESILMSQGDDVSVLRYSSFLGSIADPESRDYIDHKHTRPARSITTFYDQGWDKLIVRADKFVSIAQGNHHAAVTGGRENKVPLGLLHFHETGGARKRERCIMSMKGYGQMDLALEKDLVQDLWKQLERVDLVISRKGFGGHRVDQYRIFLLREIVHVEIRRLVSRNPKSVEEVLAFVEEADKWAKCPSELRSRILAKCSISANSSVSMGDVLFHETLEKKNVIRVDQVAKFFTV